MPGEVRKICITNRRLLAGDTCPDEEAVRLLVHQIEEICRFHMADAVILREKDLSEEAYLVLAEQVLPVCEKTEMPLILHHFTEIAGRMHFPAIHLSVPDFLMLSDSAREEFRTVGVSIHSVEEAFLAEQKGASYITASHIFPTQCKPGLPPRGTDFLREICQAVSIPVYALGGVHPDRIDACMEAGAAGVCMMSEYMREVSLRRDPIPNE